VCKEASVHPTKILTLFDNKIFDALLFKETSLLYRIVEWFGLEGTLQTILFQPPCLPPEQGAPSPVQPGPERCQAGGSRSCSGQPLGNENNKQLLMAS